MTRRLHSVAIQIAAALVPLYPGGASAHHEAIFGPQSPHSVYSPGHDVLFFGMLSVPVWRDFRDRSAQDDFRAGAGVVYTW